MPAMLWQPALAAFVIALLCVKALISETGRQLALDHPNERSLHERPVPRTGGLAIIAGVGVGWLVGEPGFAITLSLAAGLAVLSFLDDLFGLPTPVRLAGHIGAAAAVVLFEMRFPGWAAFVLLTLAVAWYANLYNFMDGADGLAGWLSSASAPTPRRLGSPTFTRSPSCAWCLPRLRQPFSCATFLLLASSWATSARCRSASWPARWA